MATEDGKKRINDDFCGVSLRNKPHRSTTDPDALLSRLSNDYPSLPSYLGHVLMHNRHTLLVDCRMTQADGYGERMTAMEMASDLPGRHQKTIGVDKNYDSRGFVAEVRHIGVTAHVAQNAGRSDGSAIDLR